MERKANPGAGLAIVTLIFGVGWFFRLLPDGNLSPLPSEPLMVLAPAVRAPVRMVVASMVDEMAVVIPPPRLTARARVTMHRVPDVDVAPEVEAVALAPSIGAPPTPPAIAATPLLAIANLASPVESDAAMRANLPAGWVSVGFFHAGSALKLAIRKTEDGLDTAFRPTVR